MKKAATPSPAAAPIEAVCRYIEQHADRALSLAELGRIAALSPGRLQRRFKAALGVSPRQYQESLRLRAFKGRLREGAGVTEALHEAGFGSSSRLYERSDAQLGMTPGQYRAGGAGVEIRYAFGDTPLGLSLIAATERGLCHVAFGDDEAALRAALEAEFPGAAIASSPAASDPQFSAWMAALSAHLEGAGSLPLPLDIRGTAFQKRVWAFLQRIPRGATMSYAEVARALGSPRAARAVAGACAANRIAVLIPCHRVIRGDGAAGGYRWGLARKRKLLDAERRRQQPVEERSS